MVHTHRPAKFHERHKDDLKQIHGIGPVMEKRLNRAGIFTFVQMADLSTKDLVALFSDLRGLSADRIAKKNWGNQARCLAKVTLNEHTPGTKGQYSAIFSVDLLLDSQHRVRRTHILHVQSRKERSWAGWNQDQVASFILENANIKFAQILTESIENQPMLKKSEQIKKKVDQKEIQGDFYISEVEIQSKPGKGTHWLVTANEPFAVGLILDMSKTSISPGTLLQYQTEIHIKNLFDGSLQKIGEDKGIIEANNLLPLVVNCHALSQGCYRLEACATLSLDMEDTNPKSRLMGMIEGKVFRVS